MTAHRASAALRMLGATAAVLVATLAGVAASGGSYALFTARHDVAPSEVRSGTAELQVMGGLEDAVWTNLVAGESVGQQVTVRNTGTAPLGLHAEGSTSGSGYELRAARGGCGVAGGRIDAGLVGLGRLAPGAEAVVCIELTVTASAAPGSATDVAVTIGGDGVPE